MSELYCEKESYSEAKELNRWKKSEKISVLTSIVSILSMLHIGFIFRNVFSICTLNSIADDFS